MTEIEELAVTNPNPESCAIRFMDVRSGKIRLDLENKEQLAYLTASLETLVLLRKQQAEMEGDSGFHDVFNEYNEKLLEIDV